MAEVTRRVTTINLEGAEVAALKNLIGRLQDDEPYTDEIREKLGDRLLDLLFDIKLALEAGS